MEKPVYEPPQAELLSLGYGHALLSGSPDSGYIEDVDYDDWE